MRSFKQQLITMNRSKRELKPVGVVLHETATPGATAQNEYTFFNSGDRGDSAHGFIDWVEDIQTIPWNEQAWHAKNPANQMFIGIEMCRPKNHDTVKFGIVYNAAVDAFARLFKYVLKINTVSKENIMSHDEVRLKWGNTSHTDPTSYLAEYGKSMDTFRKDVQNKLNSIKG